ncbi:hypothetical protein [Methylorubrum aminovorans]|uniref:hypothetical protein n=1 Tax=Methylorubrum aminovorans TaxID=269069 RepID=UPI003C2B3339
MRGLVVVHATGLMLPRGILRLGLWLVGLRGEAGKARFLVELYRRDPAGALTLWAQTCEHVLHGKDREDANSVGGWSQREIDLFLECFSAFTDSTPSLSLHPGDLGLGGGR